MARLPLPYVDPAKLGPTKRYQVRVVGRTPRERSHDVIVNAENPKQAGRMAVERCGGGASFWWAEKVTEIADS